MGVIDLKLGSFGGDNLFDYNNEYESLTYRDSIIESGTYHCKACKNKLFLSKHRFRSGTRYPSFSKAINDAVIKVDKRYSPRIHIHCSRCKTEVGFLFFDGPFPTGLRYTVNPKKILFKKTMDSVLTAQSIY